MSSTIGSPVAVVAAAAAAATTSSGSRAPSQGGILDGANPSKYSPKDPITLFIIQAGLILIMCHILHWPLSKIRQPRVIAEVIGGIILGPSVMGRIPHFKESIFPAASIPNLTLVANLGLVLYLFMIGLETDVRFLVSNWRVASSVAFAGLALPFGLGCALAWGLYHEFSGDEGIVHVEFTTYMLFIGVAIAITAFPVLCRILTELKLLDTTAGIIVLSAGVANDVIGWILLALCVALVNASNGILALWILLTALGYLLFLLFAVKPLLLRLLKWTGNIDNGPSQSMIALILLIALGSAFFTGIIGIHPIFGGFMAGLIIPRDNSFAIRVTEKLEDLIGALFLPLYFTLSGLNTNLGLLDNGITWGYVVAVTLTAFFTKIMGATVAARLSGIVWRESFAIGALMSCKGLVELIVLNIGLQAKILSTRTFTIFVVMALLTTLATTPLVSALYPPLYQKKLAAWKRGEIDWDSGETVDSSTGEPAEQIKPTSTRVQHLLVYLRLDNMPAMLNFISLFGKQNISAFESSEKNVVPSTENLRAVRAHGLHLMQLTDRHSSVMTVSEVDEYTRRDPVVNIFRTVGQFLKVAVSGEVAIMRETRFAEALLAKSADIAADLVLLPWSETGSLGDLQTFSDSKVASSYANFAKSVLSSPDTNVAVFFPKASADALASTTPKDDRKLARAYSFSDIHSDIPLIPVINKSHHIIMPFFGGTDDRYALSLVLQLCEKQEATATIVHISQDKIPTTDSDYFGYVSTHVPESIVSRVQFKSESVADVTEALLAHTKAAMHANSDKTSWHNLIVLGRRPATQELTQLGSSSRSPDDVQECLGRNAVLLIGSTIKADLLVVQAKEPGPWNYK